MKKLATLVCALILSLGTVVPATADTVVISADEEMQLNKGVKEISALRSKMWAANPKFNGFYLQEYLKEQGISREDYVTVQASAELYREASELLDDESVPSGASLIARGETLRTAFDTTWTYAQLTALEQANGTATVLNTDLHNLLDPDLTTWGVVSDTRGTAAVADKAGDTPQEIKETPLDTLKIVLFSILGIVGLLGTIFVIVKPVIEKVEKQFGITILPW